jgi:hypothetical protein
MAGFGTIQEQADDYIKRAEANSESARRPIQKIVGFGLPWR